MLICFSNRTALKSALGYSVLIFGLWIIYLAAFYPFVKNNLSFSQRALLNESMRFCIFVAPVLLYLKFVARQEPFRYLRLNTNVSRGVLCGVVVGVIYAALSFARALLVLQDGVAFKPVPFVAWFTSLTVSTLIEEIAFRGFLLQQLERALNFWTANVLTACLFVAIHFPGWLLNGSTLVPGKLFAMANILFLGLLLGYLLKRTGSLWSCFILHAINNLAAIILFG